MIRAAAIFLALIPLLAPMAHAKSLLPSNEAIHITSDQMEALDKEGKVIFKGNVVAKKGNLTIYSDQLIVFYYTKDEHQDSPGKGHALKRLVAKGNVRILEGERSARGDQAVYDKEREVIVLTGNAQVWQGKNIVKGSKITVFLNEDKSTVESAPGEKVEAVVYTNPQ